LQSVYFLLIPFLPKYFLEKLAEEEIKKLHIGSEQHLRFDDFAEVFANIASRYVENVDIESSIGFIDLVFARTSKIVIKNVKSTISQDHLSILSKHSRRAEIRHQSALL